MFDVEQLMFCQNNHHSSSNDIHELYPHNHLKAFNAFTGATSAQSTRVIQGVTGATGAQSTQKPHSHNNTNLIRKYIYSSIIILI